MRSVWEEDTFPHPIPRRRRKVGEGGGIIQHMLAKNAALVVLYYYTIVLLLYNSPRLERLLLDQNKMPLSKVKQRKSHVDNLHED